MTLPTNGAARGILAAVVAMGALGGAYFSLSAYFDRFAYKADVQLIRDEQARRTGIVYGMNERLKGLEISQEEIRRDVREIRDLLHRTHGRP